jgi:hypothetical protein
MATATSAPNSRWLLRDNVDRLAASHADVVAAISALNAAAAARRDRSRPPLRQRIAARQDWPQTIWFGLVLVATAFFLIWVSMRLVARLAPLPVFAAVVPGVLLTAAVAGAARHQAHTIERLENPGITELLRPSIPLSAAAAGVVTWVGLWLVLTSGTPVWSAVTFAIVFTVAVAVAMVTCSYLGKPSTNITLSSGVSTRTRREPSRPLRVRHRRVRKRLDDHTGRWMKAAHRYAVTITGTGQPEEILARLLSGDDERFAPDGIDPYDVMILSALRNYHPATLAAGLDAVAEELADDGTAQMYEQT